LTIATDTLRHAHGENVDSTEVEDILYRHPAVVTKAITVAQSVGFMSPVLSGHGRHA
jgi:acyl-CoA synthetase (AMP-forming)/AMP-acid ligase II